MKTKSNPHLVVNAVSSASGRITELGNIGPDGVPRWRLSYSAARAAIRADVTLIALLPWGRAVEICLDAYAVDADGQAALRTAADSQFMHMLQNLPQLPAAA